MTDNIFVKKMNGKLEPYKNNKIRYSLKKSGADDKTINEILKKIDKILYNGIQTKKIFRFAFDELKKYDIKYSFKYNLKKAILDLRIEGGYVFEKFIGLLFKKKGYSILMNQKIKGEYISHEIDVSAKKKNEKMMIECKHHKKPWLGCSIQTALYVYARFLDIRKSFTNAMLVTNTKFSSDVIRYSKGVNLGLMGWKYPNKNSLEDNIEKFKLYPVTILNLSKSKINKLFERNIFTINDLNKIKQDILIKKFEIPQEIIIKMKKGKLSFS